MGEIDDERLGLYFTFLRVYEARLIHRIVNQRVPRDQAPDHDGIESEPRNIEKHWYGVIHAIICIWCIQRDVCTGDKSRIQVWIEDEIPHDLAEDLWSERTIMAVERRPEVPLIIM